jgi:thioredoxin 1
MTATLIWDIQHSKVKRRKWRNAAETPAHVDASSLLCKRLAIHFDFYSKFTHRSYLAMYLAKCLLCAGHADSAIISSMSSLPLPPASQALGPTLVACLCADWCGSCREYQDRFAQISLLFPGAQFVWVDIEDEADLVDPVEVDNFPTLLVAVNGQATFFGTITPQPETLERLVRAQLEPGAATPVADVHVQALAQRLRQFASA